MNEYDLATWLISLRDIMAQREFIKKQDALLIVVESVEDFIDLYEGGSSPMEAYMEYRD